MINDKYFSNFRYEVDTPQYLHRATLYYKRRYHGVLFIVASAQDDEWVVKHMPMTPPSECIAVRHNQSTTGKL